LPLGLVEQEGRNSAAAASGRRRSRRRMVIVCGWISRESFGNDYRKMGKGKRR
jgi:hypothetical protein